MTGIVSRIVVGVVGLPVVLGLVWLGGWWLFGLLAFAAVVAVHEFVTMARPLRPLAPAYARLVARPSLVLGAVFAIAATSTTHEILHYRHVWALLGILGGVYLYGRQISATPVPQPDS